MNPVILAVILGLGVLLFAGKTGTEGTAKVTNTVNAIIAGVARAGGIPLSVAQAIAQQESSLNLEAFNPEGSLATPQALNGGNPSSGLYQIRWSTAQALKKIRPDLPTLTRPADLFLPANQQAYAAALAADIKPRAKTAADFAAIWNGGAVRKIANGNYVNQDYVNYIAKRAGLPVSDLGNTPVV